MASVEQTVMAGHGDKKPSIEAPIAPTPPRFTLANSIIAHCMVNNQFRSTYYLRGPGIFAAGFASFPHLPLFHPAKAGSHLHTSFESKMEEMVATGDDAHSYSSFTSTIISSDGLTNSGLSTPSTMVGDELADSPFSSASARCSSPFTPPSILMSSFRESEVAMTDTSDTESDEDEDEDEDEEDHKASYEDSDCDIVVFENDDQSETGSVYFEDSDEEMDETMDFEESEDGESCVADDEGEDDDGDIGEQLSFISFERSVHFSCAGDEVIPSGSFQEPLLDDAPEMTCHERMLLSEQLKQRRRIGNFEDGGDYDPEEHSRESLQIDKHLLFAYINGLRTLNQANCKIALRSRTLHATPPACIVNMDARTERDLNEYLERIADLLRGIFPNLFTDDEYTELLTKAESAISFDDYGQLVYEDQSVDVQHTIRGLLAERLDCKQMFLKEEMLEWFAGNLIAPLGRQALLRRNHNIE